jgi:hypothetical protein
MLREPRSETQARGYRWRGSYRRLGRLGAPASSVGSVGALHCSSSVEAVLALFAWQPVHRVSSSSQRLQRSPPPGLRRGGRQGTPEPAGVSGSAQGSRGEHVTSSPNELEKDPSETARTME